MWLINMNENRKMIPIRLEGLILVKRLLHSWEWIHSSSLLLSCYFVDFFTFVIFKWIVTLKIRLSTFGNCHFDSNVSCRFASNPSNRPAHLFHSLLLNTLLYLLSHNLCRSLPHSLKLSLFLFKYAQLRTGIVWYQRTRTAGEFCGMPSNPQKYD